MYIWSMRWVRYGNNYDGCGLYVGVYACIICVWWDDWEIGCENKDVYDGWWYVIDDECIC
jgi:hypothetical protein